MNLGLWELLGFCEREVSMSKGLPGSKEVRRNSIARKQEMLNKMTTLVSKKQRKWMRSV